MSELKTNRRSFVGALLAAIALRKLPADRLGPGVSVSNAYAPRRLGHRTPSRARVGSWQHGGSLDARQVEELREMLGRQNEILMQMPWLEGGR
jgi:hypothetical protein